MSGAAENGVVAKEPASGGKQLGSRAKAAALTQPNVQQALRTVQPTADAAGERVATPHPSYQGAARVPFVPVLMQSRGIGEAVKLRRATTSKKQAGQG